MKTRIAFLLLLSFLLSLLTACSGTEAPSGEDIPVYVAEFHVSPDGTEDGDGSEAHPFSTLEAAQKAARASAKGTAVMLHKGTYLTEGLTFTEEDSGTLYAAFGDGEVILNGGLVLRGEDFTRPGADFLDRLSDQTARDRIYCVDLKAYGLTRADWGELHAIGAFNTAAEYGEEYTGSNCELFWNGKRQTLARWPNEGNETVVRVPKQEDVSRCYQVREEVTDRAGRWADLSKVWVYGCFMYNWADASSPLISVDTENHIICQKFREPYGIETGGQFFFYNIPEELDVPGEFYLDRENGLLYVCSDTDPKDSEILFNYRDISLLTFSGANEMTLRGMTLLGVRGNAVTATGNQNRFENLTIRNITGTAISVTGSDNTVSGCDISHTGQGGIYLIGGDRITLTKGNNLAYDNYIHDWSEIYQTYQAGILLTGCGNTASHNELCNAPHEAIGFSGNEQVIEYNYIHETVLLSDDAGVIYGGRNWTAYGTVIRYNLIVNAGDENHNPCGIYMDDALSGIEIYGNLLYNIGDSAFAIGGGRSIQLHDNIVVSNATGISFDQRARDGYFHDDWFKDSVVDGTGVMWQGLKEVPYQEGIWAERYPELARLKDTYEDPYDPDFGPNPAYAVIRDNLLICRSPMNLCSYVEKYGTVENNKLEVAGKEWLYFDDIEDGDFTFSLPEAMPKIPIDEIGRVTK